MPLVHAQSGFDIAVGFGAAQDKATGNGLDGNINNFFNPCTTASSSTCVNTSDLSGFMMGVQGNLMLWKHFGVGAEFTTQPAKQDYVTFPQSTITNGGYNLQSRATFYDFNGIYQPYKAKKAAIQLIGGIGGLNLKFYASGTTTDAVLGSQSFSQLYGSSNHFQVHGGAGVSIYLTDHAFIRPEFDVHYVRNLTQFGSSIVTEETVWLGYTFGNQ
jgi:hypothetical protein